MEEFRTVALSDCYESPLNTRRHFDEAALKDLTESVASKGVLTPLLVRERSTKHGTFEILAGARRCRAARKAELASVPVRVCNFNDDEALEVIVIENLQREDVHPLEEAEGYKALLARPDYDVAAIAAKVGKSESYVYQRLKLLDLIKPAKDAFLSDAITAGHAGLIARLQPADQTEALKHCFEQRWDGKQHQRTLVSSRVLGSYIESELLLDLHAASFPKADSDLLPKAGTCTTCPKRSGFAPALFQDLAKKDVCTDRACFKAKLTAHLARERSTAEAAGEKVVSLTTNWHSNTKGLVVKNNWAEAGGKKKCASAVKGLIVEGDHDVGRVLSVCVDPTCKVHRPHRSASSSSDDAAWKARQRKAEATARRDAEVRRRLFAAVMEAAPSKLGREELERMALSFVDEMQSEGRKVLATAFSVQAAKPKYGSPEYDKALHKWIRGLDDNGLARLIAVLPCVFDLQGQHWGDGASKGFLRVAAKQYGVNAAAIDKAVAAEAKAKADKKKVRAKAGAKKAPAAPRGKKAKPSKKAKAG